MSEIIGSPTLNLRAKYEDLFRDVQKATGKVESTFNDSNKRVAKSHENVMRQMQAQMDRLSGRKASEELHLIAQAVQEMGGTAKLSAGELSRLSVQVNQLAAAGAKVPASLSSLTGMGSKLSAAFGSIATGGGISGAMAALGPAGIAAAAGFGAVTGAATTAALAVKKLAGEAEGWGNVSAATGISIESVQKLQDYMVDAGFSADDLSTMMKKLQVNIEAGGKAFEKYGLDLDAIRKMAPEEQLRAVAQAVTSIVDPTERAAAAAALFGKSGAEHMAALKGIADGVYTSLHALSEDQIAELKKVDDQLDEAGRAWENWKKRALVAMLNVGTYSTKLGENIRKDFQTQFGALGSAPNVGDKRTGSIFQPPSIAVPEGPSDAELEAERQAGEHKVEAEKKLAETLKQRDEFNRKIIDREIEYAASLEYTMPVRKQAAWMTTYTAAPTGIGNRLTAGDNLPSVGGKGLWTKYQDVLDQEMENAAEKTKKAATETKDWGSSLNTLANQLSNLAQSTGGFTGKLLGMMSALSSGAGGIMSGIKGWKDSSGLGGIMGKLGKFSAGLGIVGSAIGAVGGLIGGIKSLFGGKSKEQKAAEKKAADDAKKQAAEDAKQAKIKARQDLESGLGTARTGAESLMARLAEGGLSGALTAALQTIVGKVGEALLKSGLGILDARLKDSQAFTAAQATAGDIAQVLAGMRQAGMIDQGLLGAAGAAAGEVQQQAVDAALAAGLSPEEAAKAGSAAIAPLLREQLNASLQSGQELDANTKALLEEAKKNGIDILADPAIESLNVQKEQLEVLKDISGKPGAYHAAKGLGPVKMPNMGGGLGPMIQTHPGELALIVPAHMASRGGIISAARGLYEDTGRGDPSDHEDRRPGGGGYGGGGADTTGGTTTGDAGGPTLEDIAAVVREVVASGKPQVTLSQNIAVTQNPFQAAESKAEAIQMMADALGDQLAANTGALAREVDRRINERLSAMR